MQRNPEDEHVPVVTLRATSGLGFPEFGEMWTYRELLYFLVLRDIKVRYRQTIFGGLWAVVQPLALAATFTLVFERVAGVSSQGVPYPLFAYTALVPWTLFSSAVGSASGSLAGGAGLISKVYFPRLIVPLASAGSFLLDFAIALVLLAVMLVYYTVTPSIAILLLPFFSAMAFMSAFAVGMWLSALNVRYRDVRYVVPFLLQLLLFASPLGYPVTKSTGSQDLLRPQSGNRLRRGLPLGCTRPSPAASGVPGSPDTCNIRLLVTGLVYFRKTERSFADVV